MFHFCALLGTLLDIEVTTRPYLLLKLRFNEAIPLFPYTPSWCAKGQVHLYLGTLSTWRCISEGQEKM